MCVWEREREGGSGGRQMKRYMKLSSHVQVTFLFVLQVIEELETNLSRIRVNNVCMGERERGGRGGMQMKRYMKLSCTSGN